MQIPQLWSMISKHAAWRASSLSEHCKYVFTPFLCNISCTYNYETKGLINQ